MHPRRVVIVGGGVAGATAAAALREKGFRGEIELIGAERQPPYNRPPLSKGYLRGQDSFADQLVRPVAYYVEHRVDLHLGESVSAIDASRQVVELERGGRVPYDQLLVTTGGRNRSPSVPGAALDGVFQLRTVQECDRIRAAARPGRRVAVVGLGFIGSEVAASLRQIGVEVIAIEPGPAPLARVLGREVGDVLAAIHREKGVDLRLEDTVTAFEGTDRVERVRTKAGQVIDCDLVVTGIGIVPNSELLERAGAAVDNGVLVDEWCRTTLPGVYAAGDVANHQHPLFGRLRVEHWNNASQQGRAAALSLLGLGAPYDYVHSFWSDQYEHSIQYIGFASRWDRFVLRGDLESRKFLGFYLQEGVIRAAMGLNRGGDPEDPSSDGELKAASRLIRARAPVDPARLADEDVALSDLAPDEGRT